MNEKEGTRLCGWRVDEGMRRKEEGSHGEGGGDGNVRSRCSRTGSGARTKMAVCAR